MTSTQLSRQTPVRARTKIASYAVLSGGIFLGALLPVWLLLRNAERLVALGLTGSLYYVVLVPLGLLAAVVLFGVLRSYAHYRGQQFGGVLELGGPVAVFVLVVLGGRLFAPVANFPLTIYVHGPGGRGDLILRGQGQVMIDTAGLRREAVIGSSGEAYFPEIPANFRGQDVPVELDADSYELTDPQQKVRLTSGNAYVEVRKGAGKISGYVEDDHGQPIVGVRIAIATLSTLSDESGHFEVIVPGNQLQPRLTLKALASEFEPWSDIVVPNSNDVAITLHHKR